MAQCTKCLLTSCVAAGDPTQECDYDGFIKILDGRDAATNSYGPDARALLGDVAEAARNMPSTLIDALADFQTSSTSKITMSAGAKTLMGTPNFWTSVDGKSKLQLLYLIEIYRGSTLHRDEILAHISNLKYTAISDDQMVFVERAQADILVVLKGANVNKAKKAETAMAYQQAQFPKVSLLLFLCNYYIQAANMKICTLIGEDFDPLSGSVKQKQFATLPVLRDPHMLSRVLKAFFRTISSISGNGAASHWSVLHEFLDTMGDDGHPHAFILFVLFECLRKIDGSKGMNIRNFMDKQFPMLYLTTITRWKAEKPEKPRENGEPSGDPRRKQKALERAKEEDEHKVNEPAKGSGFGEVTSLDGAGYKGPTKTKNGQVAFCNRWNTNRSCNAGIKSGPHKGHCAYTHVCSWCKGDVSDHYGTEKDSQGNWACPNHP